MSRSARTALVIAVATVMASIATYGVYLAVSRIPVREVEVASTKIVVAVGTLPTGTQLQDKDLKLVAWPISSPVPGSFTKLEDVVRRGLVAGVVENEPFTESKLAPLSSGAGLPPTIPPGMRAMSVRVDDVVGVAGFVVPGTRVDLVVTISTSASNDKPMSRTVLGNVLVLTSGTRIDQEQGRKGEAQPTTVVTLAVSPDDAERVALAANNGRISLALRNPLDVDPTLTAGIKLDLPDDGPGRRTGPGGNAAEARGPRRGARAAGTGRGAGSQAIRRRNHPRGATQRRDAALVMHSTSRKVASTMTRSIRHLLATACTALVVLSWPGAPRLQAQGQTPAVAGETPKVNLTTGRSTVLTTDFDITRIAVTNPAIADALVVQPREVLIDGKAPGTISLIVWGTDRRTQFDLVVQQPIASLEQQLQLLFPSEDIRVALNGDATVLSGRVSSTQVMLRVAEVAQATSPKGNIINMLTVPGASDAQQVMLQVRFAEVNRRALLEAGVALFTTGIRDFAGRVTTQQFPAPDFNDNDLVFSDFLNLFLFNTKHGVGGLLRRLAADGLLPEPGGTEPDRL